MIHPVLELILVHCGYETMIGLQLNYCTILFLLQHHVVSYLECAEQLSKGDDGTNH
jgi:hypothetical protein